MSSVTRLVNRFRRARLERDADEEIRFHLDERVRRNVASGMDAEAAEADARTRFGSIEGAKAGMRAARLAPNRAVALPGFILTSALVCASGIYWRGHERIYELSADVTAPVPVVARNPEYTAEARRAKVQGTVRVRCIVRPDGLCVDASVVRSLDHTFGLDDAAVRVLREWRFLPALREGKPVPTRIDFEIRFRLR